MNRRHDSVDSRNLPKNDGPETPTIAPSRSLSWKANDSAHTKSDVPELAGYSESKVESNISDRIDRH